MSSTVSAPTFTEAEYLALERVSDRKHEYVDGLIVAMAGARPPHNLLVTNLTVLLHPAARDRGCVVLGSDQRVHVAATGLYTYPDLIVACGHRRYRDDEPPSLLNPTILVEVTSDTTENHDRGAKFVHYQTIDSLAEYVVVSHRAPRVEHHRKLETGQWLLTVANAVGSSVQLASLDLELRVGDVYRDIDLDEGLQR
ncbi:MAG TPA: Uma2 family endonuclease [Kofleriaceae bacterium]|nr:Uma2 family endonuclease [Kofleriaceae bacterium]